MTETKEITLAEPQVSALTQLLADPDRLRDFPIETVERLFELDRQIRADLNASAARVRRGLQRGPVDDDASPNSGPRGAPKPLRSG